MSMSMSCPPSNAGAASSTLAFILPNGVPAGMPPDVSTNMDLPSTKLRRTKSRNGCKRCKIKRLKCDETMPACLQCKKRKATCPGYEKTLKWSTKYELLQPATLDFSPPQKSPSDPGAPPAMESRPLTSAMKRNIEAMAAVLPAASLTSASEAVSSSARPRTPATSTASPVETAPEETTVTSYNSSPELPLLSEDCPVLPESPSLDVPSTSDFAFADDFIDTVTTPEDLVDFGMPHSLEIDPGLLEDMVAAPESLHSFDGITVDPALTSPRLSRSLLLDFYRLPSPSQTLPCANDLESFLIQHYFKDACALFSSFDSRLNPFRTHVGRIYQSTPCIYYAICSMAAAHLANAFPNMAVVGCNMHKKASDLLHQDVSLAQPHDSSSTSSLLCIMLLGLTTSWHDENQLGEEYLTLTRDLIVPKLLRHHENDREQRETQFFEECLIYWEMLMGFVSQQEVPSAPSGLRCRRTPQFVASVRKADGTIMPHPWTGIAPTIQMMFAEVARLVRRERISEDFSAVNSRERQENLCNATSLEEDLLTAKYPQAGELADFGDDKTAKQDFVTLAEAYRCAGLLILYRVFPAVLNKRLMSSWLSHLRFDFPCPRFGTAHEITDVKLWLNSLALHILDLLWSIPLSSGVTSVLRILIVTAASELRLASSIDYFDIAANDLKIIQARELSIKRLQEIALRQPIKPIRKLMMLIQEVWSRQDSGEDLFWMDILTQRK